MKVVEQGDNTVVQLIIETFYTGHGKPLCLKIFLIFDLLGSAELKLHL